jgi:hypothetical protein
VAVGPTRRVVLAAAAAAVPLLVTACRGVQVLGTPPPAAPDVQQLRSAIAAERLLIARYHAAIEQARTFPAGPGQGGASAATVLAALRTEHDEHLAQLTARLIEPAGLSARSSGPATGIPGRPGDLATAIAALAAAEQEASDRLGSQLLAVPPSLAQLMASISASEATHVPVLDALRQAR